MPDDSALHVASPGIPIRGRATALTVSVRELTVMADIGVNPDELGRPQPLVLTVNLTMRPVFGDRIDRTFDYRIVAAHAERLAQRRTGLIETFAEDLARLCLTNSLVLAVEVQVDKPQALPNGIASTRISMSQSPR